MTRLPVLILLVSLSPAVPRGVTAAPQENADPWPGLITSLPPVVGREVERWRLSQLVGESSADGFLLRSPSTMARRDHGSPAGRIQVSILAPVLYSVWNSHLPFSLNEGNLWAGRGLSARLSAGVQLDIGRVSLLLAPELVSETNGDFQTLAYPETNEGAARHRLASPFHDSRGSMDLPQRFGTEPRRFGVPGQSSLALRIGAAEGGLSTEHMWWGPGVRNAILMSGHAPGFPHLFLRTRVPVDVRVGTLEALWVLGRVEESDYFDLDPTNDGRSLSAAVFVLSPVFEPDLSVGIARAVYAPAGDAFIPIEAGLDFLRNVGRPSAPPGDSLLRPAPDQLFMIFTRWIFPEAGFEVYGEWGRWEQPASLRDFLELPHHSRGYTVGLQYARPTGSGLFRLEAEITNLEPSTSYRGPERRLLGKEAWSTCVTGPKSGKRGRSGLCGRIPPWKLPVHLVRRDEQESRNTGVQRRCKENPRTLDVRANELDVPLDRAIHVGLGGEVDHRVNANHGAAHRLRVADVSACESEPWAPLDGLEVLEVPRVGEGVEHHDLVPGLLEHEPNEVRAHETGAPGDEELHGEVGPPSYRATSTSVRAKSSPLKRSGSRRIMETP